MKPRAWIIQRIINLSDNSNGDAKELNLEKLQALAEEYSDNGYLVNAADFITFIPCEVKAIAAECLLAYMDWEMGQPVDRKVVLSYFPSAILISCDELIDHVNATTSLIDIFQGDGGAPDPTQRASWPGFPAKNPGGNVDWQKSMRDNTRRKLGGRHQPKFATLICFEGVHAEEAAKSYQKYLYAADNGGQTKIVTPDEFVVAQGLKAEVCCIEFHDCQKHPLKG